jgi:hypothetical protein
MFRPEERIGFVARLRVLPGIIAVRMVLLFDRFSKEIPRTVRLHGGQGRSSERIVRLHRHGKLDLLLQLAEDRLLACRA